MATAPLSGTLPRDANLHPIPISQAWTATDATAAPATAQTSPISAADTQVALVWPTDAVSLSVYLASTAGRLRTTTASDVASCVIPQATWFTIPGKQGDTTFFKRDGSTTLDFCFEKVG